MKVSSGVSDFAQEGKGPLIGVRHLQALLLCFNIIAIYLARFNVSVALVAMTNAATTNPDFPEYNWTTMEISYIISSFYWGYVLTQFPGGIICKRFGAKIMLFVATFGTAVCSALTPYLIHWGGWQAFCVLRVIQGLFQGVSFPCIYDHIAKWAPPEERNRLATLTFSGTDAGLVLAMFSSGAIASSSLGWPGISYVSAGVCVVWCAFWLLFGSNNVTDSRWISSNERQYIKNSLNDDGHASNKAPIPWTAIWTSVPFWAILIVSVSGGWAGSIMQLQTPSYMHGVLKMDIKSNSLFSTLPFVATWCMGFVFLLLADVITARQWMSLSVLRKFINTIAFWGPAAGLIAIAFLDKNQKALAIILMVMNVGLNSGTAIGSQFAIIDLSPNHSAVLSSIANCIGNIMPLITSLVVGVIVSDTTDREQWQIVFLVAAIAYFVGNLLYILWGSAEQQPWDAVDFHQLSNADECINKNSENRTEDRAALTLL